MVFWKWCCTSLSFNYVLLPLLIPWDIHKLFEGLCNYFSCQYEEAMIIIHNKKLCKNAFTKILNFFYTTKHYINASIKQSKIQCSMTWYSKYISMVSSISNVIISLHENEAVTILLYHCDIWEITFTNIFNF